jgi:hypothetical protein
MAELSLSVNGVYSYHPTALIRDSIKHVSLFAWVFPERREETLGLDIPEAGRCASRYDAIGVFLNALKTYFQSFQAETSKTMISNSKGSRFTEIAMIAMIRKYIIDVKPAREMTTQTSGQERSWPCMLLVEHMLCR